MAGLGTGNLTAVPLHGCTTVKVELMYPGGFGASVMGVLFSFWRMWGEEGVDFVNDAHSWSYGCDDKGWECHFNKLPLCDSPVPRQLRRRQSQGAPGMRIGPYEMYVVRAPRAPTRGL